MAPWPHYPTKMSLATADLVCLFRVRWKTVPYSPGPAAANPLSSKVSTSQLTMHVRHLVDRTHSRRTRTSAKRRRPLAMVKCQTATDERASQPWSPRSGVLV